MTYMEFSIHVYIVLRLYIYTGLYTTMATFPYILTYFPAIYLSMFRYFYAHIAIHFYILLRLYACMYVHVHYFKFINVTILHAPKQ